MATEETTTTYAAMVAEAEAAVTAVKDPELRRVAFDRILGTLLDKHSSQASPAKTAKRTPASHASSKSAKQRVDKVRPPRGPKSYVLQLLEDGFFREQKTIADVKAELANHGHHIALTSLSGPLQRLTQERRLRRQKIGGGDKKKGTYAYSEW
jgi:hypothetical protein